MAPRNSISSFKLSRSQTDPALSPACTACLSEVRFEIEVSVCRFFGKRCNSLSLQDTVDVDNKEDKMTAFLFRDRVYTVQVNEVSWLA